MHGPCEFLIYALICCLQYKKKKKEKNPLWIFDFALGCMHVGTKMILDKINVETFSQNIAFLRTSFMEAVMIFTVYML